MTLDALISALQKLRFTSEPTPVEMGAARVLAAFPMGDVYMWLHVTNIEVKIVADEPPIVVLNFGGA